MVDASTGMVAVRAAGAVDEIVADAASLGSAAEAGVWTLVMVVSEATPAPPLTLVIVSSEGSVMEGMSVALEVAL